MRVTAASHQHGSSGSRTVFAARLRSQLRVTCAAGESVELLHVVRLLDTEEGDAAKGEFGVSEVLE